MTKEEIKQALKERGWSYQLLAEKLRVSEGSIKNALSDKGKLTDQLAAHIELLLGNTQEQLIMYKITYPDAVVQSWLPGWDELTPAQRKAGIEAVLREATEQLVREQEARMAPEEVASLKAFCSTLRGPARVFEYKEEQRPFA